MHSWSNLWIMALTMLCWSPKALDTVCNPFQTDRCQWLLAWGVAFWDGSPYKYATTKKSGRKQILFSLHCTVCSYRGYTVCLCMFPYLLTTLLPPYPKFIYSPQYLLGVSDICCSVLFAVNIFQYAVIILKTELTGFSVYILQPTKRKVIISEYLSGRKRAIQEGLFGLF